MEGKKMEFQQTSKDKENHGASIPGVQQPTSVVFEVLPHHRQILDNLRKYEMKYRPKPCFMLMQKEINHKDRSKVINWMVKICKKYNLNTETLHLAVGYLDRYLTLQVKEVKKSSLRLVGGTALYIASKYQQNVDSFSFLTEDNYTKKQVLDMENIMLHTLSHNLFTPTSCCFINAYLVLFEMPNKLKYLAMYISELSLVKGNIFMGILPSLVASASIALARHLLGMDMWTPELQEITTYKLNVFKRVIRKLSIIHKSAKS
ncbi:G2/mitotic-specific cyclin-A-like [Drosophila serrata]|uniref:G2/mitotic-specific cyclin-A-like n=1 Tax=Drosophila serrata TaxID=7274 RepID=UPI000A1D0677|nr:G2/mitotic-specific cyclin-A-like [Drosophila serrata]